VQPNWLFTQVVTTNHRAKANCLAWVVKSWGAFGWLPNHAKICHISTPHIQQLFVLIPTVMAPPQSPNNMQVIFCATGCQKFGGQFQRPSFGADAAFLGASQTRPWYWKVRCHQMKTGPCDRSRHKWVGINYLNSRDLRDSTLPIFSTKGEKKNLSVAGGAAFHWSTPS